MAPDIRIKGRQVELLSSAGLTWWRRASWECVDYITSDTGEIFLTHGDQEVFVEQAKRQGMIVDWDGTGKRVLSKSGIAWRKG
jgi:hypothetical protein